MTEHLAGFARALRQAGEPVAVAEVLDAAAAVRAAGVGDRATFRLALRACVAKSPAAGELFDRLFDAWFSVPWPVNEEAGKRKKGQRQRPTGEGHRPSGGPAAQQLPLPAAVPQQAGRAAEPDGPPERGRGGRARLARQEAQRQHRVARQRAVEAERRQRGQVLRQRPLRTRLPAAEAEDLAREVERLGRLLRTQVGRRYARAGGGRLDLRATTTTGLRTGGVPFRLLRRRPRVLKPRLLVLCDVSGSVIRTARFLLRLLHETQRLFDRTEGFVFVDRPVSALPLFRQADFGDALAELERLPGLDLHALSDFGNVFYEVLHRHAELLTRRTTVLVLGDARCNRFDPQAWALVEIRRRIANVVWLNPEQAGRWYTHDSRLRDYQPHLDHLLPAACLDDLAAAVRLLARRERNHSPGPRPVTR